MSAPNSTDTRLAVYGSLAPGEVNHHELAGLRGRWYSGTVRGTRYDSGWGATMGYPGMVLDPAGPTVDVQIFESPDLPEHWARLDEFEGPGYCRTAVSVRVGEDEISAWIYALAE